MAEITTALFEEWRSTCGVREIQQPYNQLVAAAERNGREISEEMKARGFRDFNAFSKSCSRFDLFCWPSQLGELGSGHVLYFHFLTFLGFLLLSMFILQVPALALYNTKDAVGNWYEVGASKEGKRFVSIPHSWLSPGNTGPSGEDAAYLPVIYLFCVFFIIVMTYVAYNQQTIVERKVDGNTTLPNDFAILVRGMPTTATDERAIKAFFEEHALASKTKAEVVKVVIGWDAAEYGQKLREVKELRKQMAEMDSEDPQVVVIKDRIKEVLAELASAAPDRAARLTSSGIVVIIFRYQCDLRACLKRWDNFWAKALYREPEDLPFLPAGNGTWFGEELPRFPSGDSEGARLTVERAANPGDILWEELGVDPWTRWKMLLRTNGCMLLVVVACFVITHCFNVAQEYAKAAQTRQGSSSARVGLEILSFFAAIAVAVLNGLLQYAGLRFGDEEYHDTWTEQEFSQAAKITFAMMINTAGGLFIQHAQPAQWYEVGGLTDDVFMMLLTNSLIPPLLHLVSFGYLMKMGMRSKLTQERLDAMNDAIRVGRRPKCTDEDKAKLETVKQEVEYFKRAWTPSVPKGARRYAKALNIFFCCLLYSPILPWVALIGCFGLFLQYWVDKYMLLRWSSRPSKPASGCLCLSSSGLVHCFAPILFAISWYMFLTPSWQDKDTVRAPFAIALVASLMVFVAPMHIVKGVLDKIASFGGAESEESLLKDTTDDYYNAQYMWPKGMKYHKDHFLYKHLSEAVNPEHLSPGVDSPHVHDHWKEAYSEATADAAEKVGVPQPPVLKGGGRVESTDHDAFQLAGGTLSPIPGAEIEPPTSGHGSASSVMEIPTESFGVRHWEFGLEDGTFKPFNDDCQAYMEKRYVEYKDGRGSCHIIRTVGMKVSVDFEKMTSRVENSHKVRPIRRVP